MRSLCVWVIVALLVEELGSCMDGLVGVVARASSRASFGVRVAVDRAEGLLVGELRDVIRDNEAAVYAIVRNLVHRRKRLRKRLTEFNEENNDERDDGAHTTPFGKQLARGSRVDIWRVGIGRVGCAIDLVDLFTWSI
jgi:hypothetical protein